MRIVIVDDMKDDTFFLAHAIRKAVGTCQIHTFPRACDALDWFDTHADDPVDACFVDLSMPLVSGFDFLDAYTDLPAVTRTSQKPKMIMVSHSPLAADRIRAEDHPAVDGFLVKPLDPGALLDLIATPTLQ